MSKPTTNPLSSWVAMNEALKTLSEKDCWKLLEQEKKGQQRAQFMLRIHGRANKLRGIAFDGGHGITGVDISADGGKTWQPARLGQDFGKYSFREWTSTFTPPRSGNYELKVRAMNRIGQSQPMEALWNPSGYMRNVIETTRVTAA